MSKITRTEDEWEVSIDDFVTIRQEGDDVVVLTAADALELAEFIVEHVRGDEARARRDHPAGKALIDTRK